MKERLKLLIKCVVLAFYLSSTSTHAQILKDTASINLIRKGIDYIYNFEFKNADEVWNKIRVSYPMHPVVSLFKGMLIYWENYPLLPTSPARASFEVEMRNCIDLCEKKHNPDYEAEYLLANLCARGMLLLFYSDNDLNLEVFHLAPGTYKYIERAFEFTSVYPDFFFFTGLYNYYREAYPEIYPVYKPLGFLFPKGDKSKGLNELQIAAQNSIVLKAESCTFLSYIFLEFENNYKKATNYNKALYELYPANLEYTGEYIKNLLLVKKYDEAERLLISSGSGITNTFYQAQFTILNGILLEKLHHDYKKAQEYYIKGARDIELFGNYGNEFAAYAYFGLSRTSEVNGDKYYEKMYRRLAIKLADFKKVDFDE